MNQKMNYFKYIYFIIISFFCSAAQANLLSMEYDPSLIKASQDWVVDLVQRNRSPIVSGESVYSVCKVADSSTSAMSSTISAQPTADELQRWNPQADGQITYSGTFAQAIHSRNTAKEIGIFTLRTGYEMMEVPGRMAAIQVFRDGLDDQILMKRFARGDGREDIITENQVSAAWMLAKQEAILLRSIWDVSQSLDSATASALASKRNLDLLVVRNSTAASQVKKLIDGYPEAHSDVVGGVLVGLVASSRIDKSLLNSEHFYQIMPATVRFSFICGVISDDALCAILKSDAAILRRVQSEIAKLIKAEKSAEKINEIKVTALAALSLRLSKS